MAYDSESGTLTVEDNGIGMTIDEIRRYINQIAFSGVMDFVEKYKDKGAETDGIIGHFGLGFYSAFMVADQVRIDTRSWQSDAQPASWQSQDGMAYEMGTSERVDRGTLITVTLSEEGKEFLNGEKVREILEKYCGFMPYPIYFNDVVADRERAERARKASKKEVAETADPDAPEALDATADASVDLTKQPINDVEPLWLKKPSECTDEEYRIFSARPFVIFASLCSGSILIWIIRSTSRAFFIFPYR